MAESGVMDLQRKQTLWELDSDLQDLELAIECSDPGDDEQLFDALLDQAKEKLADKIDGFASLIRERELRAAAVKEEAARMTKLADVYEKKAARLKALLQLWLSKRDTQRFETRRFSIRLQDAGGVPKLHVPALEEVPPEWRKSEVRVLVDTQKIREALGAGQEVPGCWLERRKVMVIR